MPANSIFGVKVDVSGAGNVSPPTLMGAFIADVLLRVVPPEYDRASAKRWLAAEMMLRLRAEEGFPSEQRRLFVNAVLDEFNVTTLRDVKKLWLIQRLHDLMRRFEAAQDGARV